MRLFSNLALTTGLLLAVGTSALAQGGPGGGGLPPELAAKIKQWQKFQESHKNFTTLQKTMIGFGECEKDPKTALNKDQAKLILGLIKQWEKKPIMSNDEAGALVKAMGKGMTLEQIKTSATAKMPDYRSQMAKSSGGGANSMANFKLPDAKEYNPLNADTMPVEQARPMMKKSLEDFKAKLAAKLK